MYLIFWVGVDSYRMTCDVNRLYMWSTAGSCEKDIPRDIVEVLFSNLYGCWRTRLFSVLVTLEDKVVLIFW
jgi:hypothetical protein